MPLLTSPIDGAPMRQIVRNGIEIDVCPTTGGVWLDKGELEKLLALLRDDAVSGQAESYRHGREDSRSRSHYRDHDDDDDDRHGHGHKPREGKMSRIMDIFDF